MNRNKIIKFIKKEYPFRNAIDHDFNGLQIKTKNKIITKILLCLDLTSVEVDIAIKNKIDLIISHHPFFYGDQKDIIKTSKYHSKINQLLINNNINYFALHTPIDNHKNGLGNFQLNLIAKDLKLNSNEINFNSNKSYPYIKNQTILRNDLLKSLSKIFNLSISNGIDFNQNEIIKSIAIGSGASGFLINDIKEEGFDLYIVGELKWNQIIEAIELKQQTIIIGHKSEDVFIQLFKKILETKFKELIIIESKNNFKQVIELIK